MEVIINQKEIGNNILKLITASELSLDAVSKRLKIPMNKISSYVEGKSTPSLNDLIKLCNYFKIDIDTILSYNLI